jgi:outer membrane protein assembly factor BamA/autotransporter translocation and assembly factor TamB
MATTGPTSSPEPKPKRKRRWVRAVLWGLAPFALGAGLFAFGIFPQDALRTFVETRLRQALGPEARLGGLHLLPVRLQAEVWDVVVVGPGYRLELPHARVALSATALLHGDASFRYVEVERPRVALRPAPTSEKSTVRLPAVDRVQVTDGSITYSDPALGGDVAIEGVAASGGIGPGPLDVNAKGGEWRRPVPVPIGAFHARLVLPRALDDVRIESLEAGTPASRLRLHGRVGDVNAPDVDLAFEADVDARDAAYFGQEGTSGRLHGQGTAKGKVETLELEAHVDGTEMASSGVTVDRVRADVRHSAATAKSTVDATASLLGGRVVARGEQAAGALSARVEAADLQVDRLPKDLRQGMSGKVSGRVDARGRLDGPVQVDATLTGAGRDPLGADDRFKATARGPVDPRGSGTRVAWRLDLDRTPPRTPATSIGATHLTVSGTASGALPPVVEGRAVGTSGVRTAAGEDRPVPLEATFVINGTRIQAELRAEGSAGTVHGSLAANGADIERLILKTDGLDLQPLLAGAGSGRLEMDADVHGTTDRLSGTASVHLRDLKVRDAELGDLQAGLQLHEGAGKLDLSAPALHVTGNADLSLGPKGRVAASLKLDQMPLAPFGPFLSTPAAGGGPTPPVEGQVSAVLELEAPLAKPADAEVRVALADSTLTRGALSAHALPSKLTIRNGVAELEKLVVEVNGARLEVAGRAAPAPSTNDLTLRIAAPLAEMKLPAPWVAAGRIEGEARLTGTIDRPVVAGNMDLEGVRVASAAGSEPLVVLDHGRIDLERDRVVLRDTTAAVGGGTVDAGGELPLAALGEAVRARLGLAPSGEAARLLIRWKDVQTGPLVAALRPGQENAVETTLAGQLEVTSAGAPAKDLKGELRLEPAKATAAGVDLETDALVVRLDAGVVTLEPFHVRSGEQALEAAGRFDVAKGAIDGKAQGHLNLRALNPVAHPIALGGEAQLDVSLGGTLQAPRADGGVELRDVSVRMPEIPQPLTGVNGRLVLGPGEWRVESVSGRLGGGTVEMSGTIPPSLSEVNLTLAARDLALTYPGDLKSRISADLKLVGPVKSPRLEGDVRIERGLFDKDIFLDQAIIPSSEASALASAEPSPMLAMIGIDVNVITNQPVVVHNNLADLSVTGRMQARGDLATPAPFGRLEIEEGGVLYLQTRKFTIQTGSLSYAGTLDPEINIQAETAIREPGAEEVEITVAVNGPLSKPELKLTSDPSYSEREIASLIATGRRNVALDSSAWVAGEQTAALLAGRLTRNVAKGLMDLGLDEVDIQPELLARETDPGVRFSFGKQLTPQLKLVYSLGLADPEGTFYQAEYKFRVGADGLFRVQRDQEGVYTYGIGQRWRWGAPFVRERRPRNRGRHIQDVRVTGEWPLEQDDPRQLVKVEPGKRATPWDVQDDASRLERRLVAHDYIEALVSARLDEGDAVFDVRPGQHFRWEVEGLPDPPDLTKIVREARLEGDALDAARKRLVKTAEDRGYPRAKVQAEATGEGSERTLKFVVDPGPRIENTIVRFPGAHVLSEKALLGAAGGPAELLNAPKPAIDRIKLEYRKKHHIAPTIGDPVVTETDNHTRLVVEVPVDEGKEAHIVDIRFEGAEEPADVLLPLTALTTDTPYDEAKVGDAIQKVRDYYLKKGFASVRVASRLIPRDGDLELVFAVTPGEAQTIGTIEVTGLDRTRESLVRGRIDFKTGDPLDPRRLVLLERRLLELNVFSRVVVTATQDEEATILVQCEERGPYTLSYDARFSRDEQGTGVIDGEVGNLGGLAIAAGARYRAGKGIRETRGSLTVPTIGQAKGVTAAVYYREEDFRLLEEASGPQILPPKDTEVNRGFEVQRSTQLPRKWGLLYGYNFRRVSGKETGFQRDVSELQASILRDTRDDPLDPRRGRFVSLTFNWAPKFLGSELAFYRTYGQAFGITEINKSLAWAQGYRLGLAAGLPQDKLEEVRLFGRSSELFSAGGGGSLRGYATDSVGPEGIIAGVSPGGQAVIVINEELRYRHPTGLGVVLFWDAGNVYPRVKDIDLKLLHSVGFGLRYASPFGLLRIDFGFPVNPRPGDRGYQWFFNLGQAF